MATILTNNNTVVLSDPLPESHIAGKESTVTVSEYKFGVIWKPDIESQASATGGKQRNLQRPAVIINNCHQS